MKHGSSKPNADKCTWALYQGLWHQECNSFLTTTDNGELAYAEIEIPCDRVCPECGKDIVVGERQFGRRERMG